MFCKLLQISNLRNLVLPGQIKLKYGIRTNFLAKSVTHFNALNWQIGNPFLVG